MHDGSHIHNAYVGVNRLGSIILMRFSPLGHALKDKAGNTSCRYFFLCLSLEFGAKASLQACTP